MEKKYTFLNNITGWAVMVFASLVYILTIEASASFWDCGEFIAAATKQQVGHPPGAPLWSMIARVFASFAGEDKTQIAAMVNIFSALCSSFSILFLFWTITAMAKKIALKDGVLTMPKIIVILGSGLIGALAYTFSDSFWFSAVEAEVYAASSLFTALVFWLILKWEANADKKYADRYLILVAYFMGLSIGVHILNLLAIPALVYVYYFKRFETTRKGFIYAGIASIAILLFVQYGVISYSVKLATKFELFFVNTLGLPFDSGFWIFVVLIITGIVAGVIYTNKRNWPNLQNSILSIMVILIGYSSFAMIVIRSAANPPMDENNPENILTLLPYLNREQYGDRPLGYGHTFTSEQDVEEPYLDDEPVYYRPENGDKYLVADERKGHIPQYDAKTCMYFPRMYSKSHAAQYEAWTDFKGKPVRIYAQDEYGRKRKVKVNVPTFQENLNFFFSYQFNFMYWRYLMWNFSGRQNDIQGHGVAKRGDAILKGNWISGVPFIDNAHVGDQSTLPDSLKNNPGRNTFFMLPLILGIIGMVFQFSKSAKDGWVTLVFFFMTGIAIVIYLNQTPMQPRERDYAYAGSFYAFAIWIGLGVQALYYYMMGKTMTIEEVQSTTKKKGIEAKLTTVGLYEILLTAVSFIIVGVVLSLAGKFEVFALSCLYIGLVIGAVTGLSYVIGQVIKDKGLRGILAIALTAFVPFIMGAQGWDDHDRSNRYAARDFAKNYLDSCAPNAIIFTNGDNDTFPLWYVQEVEEYRTDVRVVNLSLLNTDWYIDQMKRKAYDSDAVPFSLTQDQYRQGTRDYILYNPTWKEKYVDLNRVMDFIKSDAQNTKVKVRTGEMMDYFPVSSFSLAIDSNHVASKDWLISEEFKNQIPDTMKWSIPATGLYKAKMMILDLINNNNWDRPIYFAITIGPDNFMNLEDFFELEGLAYKLTPVKHPQPKDGSRGWLNLDKLYDNYVNKFQWGNMEKEGVYVDEQIMRMSMNFTSNFARLAIQLAQRGDMEKAHKVMERFEEIMPVEKFGYSYYSNIVADAWFTAGDPEKANEVLEGMFKKYTEELEWYETQDPEIKAQLSQPIKATNDIFQFMAYVCSKHGQQEWLQRIDEVVRK